MDRIQFEAFVIEYRPLLVMRAKQITRDTASAEDTVQDTLVYLLKNLHRYNPDRASLLTWVLGAIVRRAYNSFKTRTKSDLTALADLESPGADVEYEFLKQVGASQAMLDLIRAEDPQQAYLLEALLAGWAQAEIAAKVGLTQQGISWRITAALKRWRKMLKTQFTEAEIKTAIGS